MSARWTLALGAALLSLVPWAANLVALWLWLPERMVHMTWWAPTLAPAMSTAMAALSATLLHFERAGTRAYRVRPFLFWSALSVLQFAAVSMQAPLWLWVLSSLSEAGWPASQTLMLHRTASPLITPLSSAVLTLAALRLARGQPPQGAPPEASSASGFALSHAMALQIGFLWSLYVLWAVVAPMEAQTAETDAALAVVALLMGMSAAAAAARAAAVRAGALPRLVVTLPMAWLTGVVSSLAALAIVGRLIRRGIELDHTAAIALTIAASVVLAMSLAVWWMKRLAGVRRAGR